MKGKNRSSRRAFLAGFSAIPLAGCGQTLFGIDAETWSQSVEMAVGLREKPSITLQEASRVPYSSLGYRVGSDLERMLILAHDDGEERLWTSSARRTLVTRGGRISKTARFDWNLTTTQFPDPDPAFDGLLSKLPTVPTRRLCDFQDLKSYSVSIAARFQNRGYESISIFGQDIRTAAIVETCAADGLDWEFQNTYWADSETGFVWKTEQTVHPNLDPITVEILRPPG